MKNIAKKWIQEVEENFYYERINSFVTKITKFYQEQSDETLTFKVQLDGNSLEVVTFPSKKEGFCDILIYDEKEELFYNAVFGIYNKNAKYFEELLAVPEVESFIL